MVITNINTNPEEGTMELKTAEAIRSIEKRYNARHERAVIYRSEGNPEMADKNEFWMAGAEYVLLALGLDFDYRPDGGIIIKA